MFKGQLSVFFPAFNEEENIEETVTKAVEVLKKMDLKKWEVIIVDDGSHDKTPEIADNLAKNLPNIRVIHQKNGGYGEALKTGFKNAKYEWVTYNDSDGQFDFSEINKFLDKADGADLVIGYRIDRKDTLMRKLNGWGWTHLSDLLLGLHAKDVDCAFKLIKKEVLDDISPFKSSRGAMISPELLAKAQKKGYKIVQVGVHHFPRKAGNPTGAALSVIVSSFKDLFKLGMELR